METTAKITSKGQLTLPKSVRDALGLKEGDTVVIRVDGDRAVLASTVGLLDQAGTVSVPAAVRGLSWEEVRRRAWRARAEEIVG